MSSKFRHAMILAALLWSATAVKAQVSPQRVVSINVCTDQLAMLVARPGQLRSVSSLSRDPETSMMAQAAAAYSINHGLAEEIVLLKPDLVLAGTYTSRTTISLLIRVGLRVEEFSPESSFQDIRDNLKRMGRLLDNSQRAQSLIGGMDAQIESIRLAATPSIRTALTFDNSYTSGAGTLMSDVMRHAGLVNIAAELGLVGSVRLPLELLVLSDPELLVRSHLQAKTPALAAQNFTHPAYRALVTATAEVPVDNRLTVCGGPFTVDAARALQEAAHERKKAAP